MAIDISYIEFSEEINNTVYEFKIPIKSYTKGGRFHYDIDTREAVATLKKIRNEFEKTTKGRTGRCDCK